jgi:tetratricopeptide (TPR) repeat protein
VAGDNPDGKNSWFTEALADLITQDALTLDEIFTRVRMRVEKATRGSQTPWSQTSLTNKFYFHPPKDARAANDPTIIDQWLQDAAMREQLGDWEEAFEILNRIIKQQPGGEAEEAAKARQPYVKARLDASTQFEAGKFNGAASSFEEALGMDPFALDAAEGAFRSRLLIEDLGKAVSALQILRQRGTSATSARADSALKELAVVFPEAAEELKRGSPQPPEPQELFTNRRFGVPDWAAAQRILRQSPAVDLSTWAKQLPEPPRVVAPAAEPGSPETKLAMSEGPVTLESFHVQIRSLSATRDLIREEFGELQLKSEQANTSVLLDGKPITSQLPYRIKLPAGKYVINTVDRGQVLGTREIEVTPGALVELSFK